MNYNTTYVGMDVHKATISVAIAEEGRDDPVSLGLIPNSHDALLKLLKKLEKPGRKLLFCYESGPCGYEIYRFLTGRGVSCMVAATSLIPAKAGDRVKTDKRDAKKLARLFRSGELTAVWVPDEAQEALRDMVRSREDAVRDLQRKRHQLGKFLLRLGIRPPEGVRNWSSKHRQWLDALKMEQSAHQVVLSDYRNVMIQAEDRVKHLEKEIEHYVQGSVHEPVINALKSLKGIDLITAVGLVAEVGEFGRFKNPAQLMSYAGLVPSEYSSGPKSRRGSITKTGNHHLRWLVVESAWHYRHTPKVGYNLKKRQQGQPDIIKQISWRAQNRLNMKYRKLVGRGKLKQTAIVGVARELLGFIWSVAIEAEKEMKKAA
ncbi:MAG: IS110 family transposase [Bacillota bacterium]